MDMGTWIEGDRENEVVRRVVVEDMGLHSDEEVGSSGFVRMEVDG